MKITIKNHEYEVKYTIRALFMFEQITGRSFEIKTLLDNTVFFYCMILANNPDNVLDWDEFIEALDSDPGLNQSLSAVVEEYNKKQKLYKDEKKNPKAKR